MTGLVHGSSGVYVSGPAFDENSVYPSCSGVRMLGPKLKLDIRRSCASTIIQISLIVYIPGGIGNMKLWMDVMRDLESVDGRS